MKGNCRFCMGGWCEMYQKYCVGFDTCDDFQEDEENDKKRD